MGKSKWTIVFTEEELKEFQTKSLATAMAVCLDYHEKLRQKEIREFPKRVLHNTKLLLRKYRSFKTMADHAIYSPDQAEDDEMQQMADLMSGKVRAGELEIHSIKKNAITTRTIMAHVDRALFEFRIDCEAYAKMGQPDWMRRYRTIDGLYIQFPPKTIAQIAEEESVSERSVFRDRDAACDKLSGYLWGVASMRGFLMAESVNL